MLYKYDANVRNQYGIFCGVDEAGRGPLAGNVFAAAAVLPEGFVLPGVNDSKKLKETERERLYEKIIGEKEIVWAVAEGTVAEIDELNILGATLLAMKRAVAGLRIVPNLALVDGNREPELDIAVKTAVKGDGLSASVAAASILAKTARDRYMKEQAKLYPEYAFEKHKGYGTKLHVELLLKYGACPLHRKLFVDTVLKKAEQLTL
jgi:ribonuclease HII